MAGWADLLGEGSSARQFLIWGVAYRIADAILSPPLTDLQQRIFFLDPSVAISPAAVADMVVKNIMTEEEGSHEARLSGINPDRFAKMVSDTGEPPGLEFLLQAFRRGFIPFHERGADVTSVEQGIAESHVKDKWITLIGQMAQIPLPPADAVNAVLRGQIPHDLGAKAAYASGVSADDFQVLLNTAGRPPSPTELAEFVRRGFIPFKGTGPGVLSFEQGIFEGDTKNKWEGIYEKLTDYIPPPRTITALERAGVITRAQAVKLYQENGLSPELAAAYSADASGQKIQKHKDLAEGQVLDLYEIQQVNKQQATGMLTALGYTADEITFILDLRDFQRDIRALNSAISKIANLFVAHKTDKTTARNALSTLNVPAGQIDTLISLWELEANVNVKVLTPAQVAAAFKNQVISQDEAMQELQELGYQARDAWIILSNEVKAPLPGEPPAVASDF